MSMAMVLGVGVTIIVFMLFTKLIDSSKHKQIRNFLLIIVFPFLFLIPASLVLDQTVCSMELTNSTDYYVYGDNFTAGEHWDNYSINDAPSFNPSDKVAFLFHIDTDNVYSEVCYEKPNGATGFIKAYVIILIVFMTYMLLLFGGDLIKAIHQAVRKS